MSNRNGLFGLYCVDLLVEVKFKAGGSGDLQCVVISLPCGGGAPMYFVENHLNNKSYAYRIQKEEKCWTSKSRIQSLVLHECKEKSVLSYIF